MHEFTTFHKYIGRENLYWTYDVGPYSESVQRGLEIKDLRDLEDLTIHDVKPTRSSLFIS